MKDTGKYIIISIITLAIGLLLGKWIFSGSNTAADLHEQESTQAEGTIWTCSMHPQIRQDHPGQCPICGMDLIPLEDNQANNLNPNAIRMSASAMEIAQVSISEVKRGAVSRTIRLNGKVAADERQIYTQSAHLPGRIERLLVNFTGESVSKGQVIAKIYSPDLVTAQEELFQAIKMKNTTPALYNAAREKLKFWKLTDAQIDAIEAAGKPQETFDIQADVSGIVLEKKVNLGDYLMRGEPLFTVANLSRVWVLFDAYESDLPWLKKGDRLSFTVNSLPGQTFNGAVSFIDPVVNAQTRTASVRVEMSNPGGKLKPEMFAMAEVNAKLSAKANQIIVPKSAVLWTGKRSIVYVQDPQATEPSFLLREVTLGPALGESYVVEQGLNEGETIVTNGAFSIDAAAQLAGKPSMMAAPKTVALKTTEPVATGDRAKQHVWEVIQSYLQLKDALVASDAKTTRKQATALVSVIANVPMSDFAGDAHEHWMMHSKQISELANNIAKANDLAAMRQHFIKLSDEVTALSKTFGLPKGTVYLQFCPMANHNKGAYWLSQQAEIRNPYYGDEMLTCGKVIEEIK